MKLWGFIGNVIVENEMSVCNSVDGWWAVLDASTPHMVSMCHNASWGFKWATF